MSSDNADSKENRYTENEITVSSHNENTDSEGNKNKSKSIPPVENDKTMEETILTTRKVIALITVITVVISLIIISTFLLLVKHVKCPATCEAGFEDNGTCVCHPCNIGYYKSVKSISNCTLCPGNFSTEFIGSTHQSQCGRYNSIYILVVKHTDFHPHGLKFFFLNVTL